MRKWLAVSVLCIIVISGCSITPDIQAPDPVPAPVAEDEAAPAAETSSVETAAEPASSAEEHLDGSEDGEKVLTSVCDPWPPFVDPDHPEEGLSMEIIRAAYATQGYEVVQEFVPWARAMDGLKIGEYDIVPNAWHNEERAQDFMFSEAYTSNDVKFIKERGSDFEYTGLESLTGMTVGIASGYGYGDEFMDATNFTRDEALDVLANVRRVVEGRVDLTLEDEIVASTVLSSEEPELLEKIEFTDNFLSSNDLYVISGFANPRHEEIISAFNRGLNEIKADGTYDEIFARYGIQN